MSDILDLDIVRELLTEINPDVTESEIIETLVLCGNNLYDAQLIYNILKSDI